MAINLRFISRSSHYFLKQQGVPGLGADNYILEGLKRLRTNIAALLKLDLSKDNNPDVTPDDIKKIVKILGEKYEYPPEKFTSEKAKFETYTSNIYFRDTTLTGTKNP